MRKLIVSISFIIVLAGANFVNAQVVRIRIPQPNGDTFVDSELFDTVSFVPLQPEQGMYISQNMELKIVDNDYFLLDDNLDVQCVYRFDSTGTFLNTICDEKPELIDDVPVMSNRVKFNVDPYRKHVELYNFEDAEIRRFSFEGNKLDVTKIKFNPSDFTRDQNGDYWLYMGWNNGDTSYRLIKINAKGETLDRKMRLVSNCTTTEGFSFYAYDNRIYFWELFGSTAYRIDGDGIKPTYGFDFGQFALPLNYHTLEADESLRLIMHTGYYSVEKYMENKNFAYFFMNFNGGGQRDLIHIIHDKTTDRMHILAENSAVSAFDKAQKLTENDELVFLVSSRKLRQAFSEYTDYLPLPFEGIAEKVRPYRSPIVLKIKLVSPGY